MKLHRLRLLGNYFVISETHLFSQWNDKYKTAKYSSCKNKIGNVIEIRFVHRLCFSSSVMGGI